MENDKQGAAAASPPTLDTDAAPAHDAAAPAGQGEAQGAALADVAGIVELADQLSACADQLHARILRDIGAWQGQAVPEPVQAAARALLENEIELRQRANGLYADAATHVVQGLGKSQRTLVGLTTAAAEKIRKIALLGDVTGLVAGLLQLAGAAASGQALPVLAALETIQTQLRGIEQHRAPARPA
jgi:hypothetical protein